MGMARPQPQGGRRQVPAARSWGAGRRNWGWWQEQAGGGEGGGACQHTVYCAVRCYYFRKQQQSRQGVSIGFKFMSSGDSEIYPRPRSARPRVAPALWWGPRSLHSCGGRAGMWLEPARRGCDRACEDPLCDVVA